MPIMSCSEGEKPGFKFGNSGKCYTYTAGDASSRRRARQRAVNQGIAMGEINTSKADSGAFASFFGGLSEILSRSDATTGGADQSDTDVEKAAIGRTTFTRYFAIRGDNIVDVGFDLNDDEVDREEHDNVGRYALMIIRINREVNAQVLDEGVTTAEAHNEAINLVENNRNNVMAVGVLVGIPYSFASRPVYRQVSVFERVSKEDFSLNNQNKLTGTSPKKDNKNDPVVDNLPDATPFELRCIFSKAQPRLNEGLVYGIVYPPNELDTEEEFAFATDIQKACHEFLPRALLNLHHDDSKDLTKQDAVPVESYIAPCDFYYVPGDDTSFVKKGSWVLVSKVFDDAMRREIEKGEITGYSMEGTARKVAA